MKFDKWKNAIVSIERKGMKMNMDKMKVMVRSEGSVRVVNHLDPCGVCD